MKVKINGVVHELYLAYQTPVSFQYNTLDNHRSHTFPTRLQPGTRFHINGNEYEVLHGSETRLHLQASSSRW